MTDKQRAILAVINCGIDQGMTESAFGGTERTTARRMAHKGLIKITRVDGAWLYATRA